MSQGHKKKIKPLNKKQINAYFQKAIQDLQEQHKQAGKENNNLKRKDLKLQVEVLQTLAKQKKVSYQTQTDLKLLKSDLSQAYIPTQKELKKSIEQNEQAIRKLRNGNLTKEDNIALLYKLQELQRTRDQVEQHLKKLTVWTLSWEVAGGMYIREQIKDYENIQKEIYAQIKQVRATLDLHAPPPSTSQQLIATAQGVVQSGLGVIQGFFQTAKLGFETVKYTYDAGSFIGRTGWIALKKITLNPKQDLHTLVKEELQNHPFVIKTNRISTVAKGITEGINYY